MSVEVQLAQMVGRLELMQQSYQHLAEGMSGLIADSRQQAGVIARLDALNIQDRLTNMSNRIDKLEVARAKHTGASNTWRVMWAIFGSLGTMAITLAVKLLGT